MISILKINNMVGIYDDSNIRTIFNPQHVDIYEVVNDYIELVNVVSKETYGLGKWQDLEGEGGLTFTALDECLSYLTSILNTVKGEGGSSPAQILQRIDTVKYNTNAVPEGVDIDTSFDPFAVSEYAPNQSALLSLIASRNGILYSLSINVNLSLWQLNPTVRHTYTSEFSTVGGDANVEWWYENGSIHFLCDTDGPASIVGASVIIEEWKLNETPEPPIQ